jgi:hypothetical protein
MGYWSAALAIELHSGGVPKDDQSAVLVYWHEDATISEMGSSLQTVVLMFWIFAATGAYPAGDS